MLHAILPVKITVHVLYCPIMPLHDFTKLAEFVGCLKFEWNRSRDYRVTGLLS